MSNSGMSKERSEAGGACCCKNFRGKMYNLSSAM